MKKLYLAALVLAFAFPAFSQVTPKTNSVNINIGASALGLTGGNSVPGTDIIASINVKGNLLLRSDNILAPGAGFQGYFGGVQYPFLTSQIAKTNLKGLEPYATGSVGVDRIVPSTGPSQAHFAFLAGGGLNYTPSSGIKINVLEVRWMRAPGYATNTAVVSGGISIFFGKQQ